MKAFFLFLSTSPTARKLLSSPRLCSGLIQRFIAGNHLPEALETGRRLNSQSIWVTMNRLGEGVEDRATAESTARFYHEMADGIRSGKVQGTLALKPTQVGLAVDRELCRSLVMEIARKADSLGNTLEVDMEASAYTEATLDIYKSVLKIFPKTRLAIQAYLHRTESDLEELRKLGARIRLVKGTYREPKSVAVQSNREVNRKFMRLTEWVLKEFDCPAIGTHNEEMQNHALEVIRREKLSPERYEFQFVYGIRRDIVEQRVKEGHRVRVYTPYGSEWYPYFMRRLAERPANVWFVVKNVVREAFS
ncbi:MAG: proline dehydrogenase family protein [Acidobacteria bacterium]|nr:proline dehydrogenase family protein [Acidobacteriota bacterium]